jgi:hypothetical protein
VICKVFQRVIAVFGVQQKKAGSINAASRFFIRLIIDVAVDLVGGGGPVALELQMERCTSAESALDQQLATNRRIFDPAATRAARRAEPYLGIFDRRSAAKGKVYLPATIPADGPISATIAGSIAIAVIDRIR